MDTRDQLISTFTAANKARGARKLRAFNPAKISEDDPQGRWNPGLQGNRKWGKGYRGAANYSKGAGRPD